MDRIDRFTFRFRRERRACLVRAFALGLAVVEEARGVNEATKVNGGFGRIWCQKFEEQSSRIKRKRGVILCGKTVRIDEERKVIPTRFFKIRKTLIRPGE